MRKLKNVLRASSCCAFSILMCLPAAGQNAWSEADCVTLLDSTSVTVQPNGSGSFAVYKSFKVQTPKGAVNNHVIKYDYDPLTAFARFKQVTVQRANGETMQVDVTKTCDYAAPARAIYWGARQIMLELGRLEPEMSFPTKSVRKALLMLCWQELKMMTHVSFRPCAGSSTTLFLFG